LFVTHYFLQLERLFYPTLRSQTHRLRDTTSNYALTLCNQPKYLLKTQVSFITLTRHKVLSRKYNMETPLA